MCGVLAMQQAGLTRTDLTQQIRLASLAEAAGRHDLWVAGHCMLSAHAAG